MTLPTVNDPSGQLARQWDIQVTPTLVVISHGEVKSVTTGWTSGWGMRLRLWLASVLLPPAQDKAAGHIRRFVAQQPGNGLSDLSGWPPRCIGSNLSPIHAPRFAAGGVHLGINQPGRTPLTRIPCAATSSASPVVRVSTAPFDAA
jgi:hypothetical protein